MTTAPADDTQPISAAEATNETIRRTVKALRSARNVDVPVLARYVGVSRGSFYNRLNGAAPFLAAEVAALATFFDVPISDFFEGVVRVGARGDTSVQTGQYVSPYGSGRPGLSLVTDSEVTNLDVPPNNRSGTNGAGRANNPNVNDCSGAVNHADAA